MSKYILAHDLGTSGNKATLFDDEGRMIDSCTETYSTDFFNSNWAEQNPSDWWNAVCVSSKKVLAGIETKNLAAVSFSGQMMACLPVDQKGIPLRNAMIYCDQRSEKQAALLIEKIGFRKIYEITGHRPSSSYSLTKLMWVRDNEPDVYRNTHKVLQAKDYMNYKMTGEYFTDYNDASGTNAFDLRTLTWSDNIIEASGINPELFPRTVSSTTVIGEVTPEASSVTGIPVGTPVTAGAGDGGCATIGSGSYEPGKAYCYMGSSSWVSVTTETPLADEEMKTFTWAHPVEGLYHPCGTMQTAGSSINWFNSVFKGQNNDDALNELNQLAGDSNAGSGGLFFLPYLLGERSPWWDPNAKGAFIGIDLNTEKKHLCRAVIEGIAMNLNESFKIMQKSNNIDSIMFIGGGANGRILRQIFADIFGVKINIPQLLSEATSMGAALIGGVGTGVYPGFEIVEQMNPITESVDFNSSLTDFYKNHIRIFNELYYNLKGTFSIMSEVEYLK